MVGRARAGAGQRHLRGGLRLKVYECEPAPASGRLLDDDDPTMLAPLIGVGGATFVRVGPVVSPVAAAGCVHMSCVGDMLPRPANGKLSLGAN